MELRTGAIRFLAGIASALTVTATLTALPPGVASAAVRLQAIGAENEYANVIAQIGGSAVSVTSILNNPATDPHTFESSPSIARKVSAAQLIVQNGVGYDGFMNKMESASPNPNRHVIIVQHLLGLPDSTPNPHLWYRPSTMPVVARAIARELSALDPSHASTYQANEQRFERSLSPWLHAMASFKARDGGTPVATTEPVADYMLEAMGTRNLTPFGMQADIMNGVDPSPQDISLVTSLLAQHKVKVFVYNVQVVNALTVTFRSDAEKAGIPVVAVYETMPTPGYNFQTWMLTEVQNIQKAVVRKVSTQKL